MSPVYFFRVMLYTLVLFYFSQNNALATEQVQLRINMTQPATDPTTVLIEKWARDIEMVSNDAIQVSIYAGGELYGTRTEITAVARGHIEGAFITVDYWGRTIPVMSILSKPFAFATLENVSAYSDRQLDRYLTDAIEKKGLKVLVWLLMARMAAITTNKSPLASPTDFVGKKIRSVNLMLDSALSAVGASPIPLAGGEVYMGLQTGMIDGAITIPTAVYRRRYYEVNDYVTITPLFTTYQTLAVNRDWWDTVPVRMQQSVMRLSQQLEVDAAKLIDGREAEIPQLLREKGMTVYLTNQDEIDLLESVMEPAWIATFLEQAGNEGKDVLRTIEFQNKRITEGAKH